MAVTLTIDGKAVAQQVRAEVTEVVGAGHVRPGAAVVDVGIHRPPTGPVGDVRTEEVQGVASCVTPVPGGVEPMTIAMLVVNTLEAARWAGTTL